MKKRRVRENVYVLIGGLTRRWNKYYRGGRKGLRWCGFARFLVRFCCDFYFKLRYCGFPKPSGLHCLEKFRVISMRFEVFLCYSVRYLYVFLCRFEVFVPLYAPPLLYSRTSLLRTPKGRNQVSSLQRCPYYRGRERMIFGISGTKQTVRNRKVSVLQRCP